MHHAHLVLVHLPLVTLPLATGGHFLAWRRGEAFWMQLFEGLWLLCALLATAAYFTGGNAFEFLSETRWRLATDNASRLLAEDHAVIGRAAWLVMVLGGAVVLQQILQRAQGGKSAAWQGWLVLAFGIAGCVLLLWAASLGGPIAHPELR